MSRPSSLLVHVLRDHALLGGAAAAGVWAAADARAALLFWLANILIDADHYLHFLLATRFAQWTPGDMFRFHQRLFEEARRPDFYVLELFHTAEFAAVAAAAAWLLAPSLWPAVFGGLFHIAVDWVHLARHGMLGKRANSVIEYLWKTRLRRAR